MKKLMILLLCLLLPVSALAAPAREMRETVLSEETLAALRDDIDAAARAALPLTYEDNTYIGAQVYSCVEDGGLYVLECDVYAEEGGDSLPAFAPDEAITWLCDATVCLRKEGDGYAVDSCETGDYYDYGSFVDYDGEDFSVTLPDRYAIHDDDPYDFSWYAADGTLVSGIVYRQEDARDLNAAEYVQQLLGAEDDSLILQSREDIALLTARGDGIYAIVYTGGDAFHSLTITYPAQREAEFTLYCEFMRNSFLVAGETNG